MSAPFNEKLFNDEVFSAPAFKERERILEEKRKLFEETETAEFKRNKEEMLERIDKKHANQDNPPRIEEITEEDENDETNLSSPISNIQLNEKDTLGKDEEEEEEEEILTTEEIEQLVAEASEYKEKGNEYYKDELYEAAIAEYSNALSVCPKSQKIRSVFYANRAACWQNLMEYEKVIEDCGNALKLDKNYIKVLLRRADAYEKIDKLSEALDGKYQL